MNQKTIKKRTCTSGFGIHTGVYTNLQLIPAKANTGIRFIRIDLENNPIIKADIENVSSTERSTNLKQGNADVKTIEHLMSAIAASEIDNLIIEIDNIEIPIFDGSSHTFITLIKEAGIIDLNAKKEYLEVKKPISFIDKETGSSLKATPSKEYKLKVQIDYNSKTLGIQNAKLNSIKDFETQIASSRTFCFLHELEQLIQKNLIKGGNINNAIVITDKKSKDIDLKKISKLFNKEIEITNSGILNNISLRHENEPARHKLLDLIGDLALIGKPIKGKIDAIKPGHKNNVKFAKYLKEQIKKDMKKEAPKIDFCKPPIYDKKKIEDILPHREPFLFIDEIREIGENHIIGIKFVKHEEDYFRGHFPDEPVMPGVLQLETMAQAGGVLILSTVENPQEYLTFFMKIDNAKFKQKVKPGDTLIFHLHLISPIRRGICHMHGKGFVNNNIVVEADLLAKIAKKE